jgi:hypothetical protein
VISPSLKNMLCRLGLIKSIIKTVWFELLLKICNMNFENKLLTKGCYLRKLLCFVFLCCYAEYSTSDNEPDGIENATYNTFAKLMWIFVFLI